jgi:hypothetical protein
VPVIACPTCGKRLKLPGDYGKPRARCPSCKRGIDVPRTGKGEPKAEPAEPDLDLLLLEDAAAREVSEAPLPVAEPLPTGEDLVPVVFEAPQRVAAVPPARRRFWRTRIGILALLASLAGCGAIAVFAFGLLASATAELRNRTTDPDPDPRVILSEKQKAVAADAIKALARIEAAVQVGVNFPKYTELVIDAKAAVNEADLHLPDCELLTKLDECMQAYGDAASAWSHKIQWQKRGIMVGGTCGELIDRYELPLNEKGRASEDVAMQVIWQVAATKLTAARILQQ